MAFIVEKMFYLVPRRQADAMRGSRNALKSSPRITIYGTFSTAERAQAHAERLWPGCSHLVSAIVEM